MKMLLMSLGVFAIGMAATATSAQTMPRTVERVNVPQPGGMEGIALFKNHKKLETVTCRDFNALDESYRPQAVIYAANYGPKGKPHPTATVDGVERIVPVVVASCRAQPGNHFASAVKTAMRNNR